MKPFERVHPTEESHAAAGDSISKEYLKDRCKSILGREMSPEEYGRTLVTMATERLVPLFNNGTYQVAIYDDGPIVHLSIKRIDKKPIHDWRDLQEIKNMLVGPENEAIELYPAESRKVDGATQYHLWCFKDPEYRIPIGFNCGRVVTDIPIGKSVNNPISEQDKARNQAGRQVPVSDCNQGT